MRNQKIKIFLAIIISLFLTQFISSRLFLFGTSRLNFNFIRNLTQRPTPTKYPTPQPSQTLLPSTILSPTISVTNYPTATTALTPTLIVELTPTPTVFQYPTLAPTKRPTPTTLPTFAPTRLVSCPSNSSQSYRSIGVDPNDPNKLSSQPQLSPDVNLYLRGFTQVNETAGLVSRNGNYYGLDDRMPPQISSLFNGPLPQIVKTYRVYEWDFQNNRSLAPQTATPNSPVHMIGLTSNPGQPLYGLKAGRTIDSRGDVFLVLYATKNYILFTHSSSDNLFDGYLFYFLDICVDPNLLALYNQDNSAGRRQMPVIATGQVFGYSSSADTKVSVRDTLSFVDPRVKEDWWFYGQ